MNEYITREEQAFLKWRAQNGQKSCDALKLIMKIKNDNLMTCAELIGLLRFAEKELPFNF